MTSRRLNPKGTQRATHGCCRALKIKAAAVLSVLLMGGLFSCSNPAARNMEPPSKACVILLHGLCRSSVSMTLIERHLVRAGYAVVNIDYASTQKPIAAVAEEDLSPAVSRCIQQGYVRIHLVTHSLGAIVVRAYLQRHQLPEGSRIVMLAPPNRGSELIDWAHRSFPRLIRLAGPAVSQLGTHSQALPQRLKPIACDVGIIIGNQSWNPYFSSILPGSDDGKVTLARAKLVEMRDFWVAPSNHTTILMNRKVQHQIVHFLQEGVFLHNRAPIHPLRVKYVPKPRVVASALDAFMRQR